VVALLLFVEAYHARRANITNELFPFGALANSCIVVSEKPVVALTFCLSRIRNLVRGTLSALRGPVFCSVLASFAEGTLGSTP
jgi:hypothetical protein